MIPDGFCFASGNLLLKDVCLQRGYSCAAPEKGNRVIPPDRQAVAVDEDFSLMKPCPEAIINTVAGGRLI